MMTSYSKIRLQVSVLRTNGPLVLFVFDIVVYIYDPLLVEEMFI